MVLAETLIAVVGETCEPLAESASPFISERPHRRRQLELFPWDCYEMEVFRIFGFLALSESFLLRNWIIWFSGGEMSLIIDFIPEFPGFFFTFPTFLDR